MFLCVMQTFSLDSFVVLAHEVLLGILGVPVPPLPPQVSLGGSDSNGSAGGSQGSTCAMDELELTFSVDGTAVCSTVLLVPRGADVFPTASLYSRFTRVMAYFTARDVLFAQRPHDPESGAGAVVFAVDGSIMFPKAARCNS